MKLIKNSLNYLISHKLLLFLTVIAAFLTLLPALSDGWNACIHNTCGFIVGTNYRDGLWYQAVASTAFLSFPFRMPIFSGENLTGYHYIPNLISYLLTFVGIPISFSFYQLFPILYFICAVILAIIYARSIKDTPVFVTLFFFFTFFGISLTIVTSLYHKGYIDNALLINTFQATRLLESIHFAFSFLILLVILILIQKQIKTSQKRLLIGLLVFLVFGIKVYTAVAIALILGINEVMWLIQKRDFRLFVLNSFAYGVGAILAILLFYDPFSASKSGAIFIFSPFSTVHHIIEEPHLIFMRNMVDARYFLIEHGWSPRLLYIELVSSFLFTLFYFGTRFLGFFYIAKQIIKKKITRFEFILTTTVLLCLTFTFLFIQKGDWYNPIQFSVVAAFIMNIFAALFLYDIWKWNKIVFTILFVPVFLLTFPSNLVNATYLSNDARYVIPNHEMAALLFLKNQPDGPVLAPIIEPDMAYVSAISGKPTYFNFINVLDNNGIDYSKRQKEMEQLEELDIGKIEVKYVYVTDEYPKYKILKRRTELSKQFKEIFNNQNVIIYEKIN